MGRLALIFRLAARDVRRRPVETALLLLAIVAATTTLTLGLVLHGVTNAPYERTRNATAGPDVVASVAPRLLSGGRSADVATLNKLANASGVVAHSGPYPYVGAELDADGLAASRRTPSGEVVGGSAGVWAVGRDPSSAAPVDQPEVTEGSWVRPGGVVVEAGFADALGVGQGDRITLRTRLCTISSPTTPPSCSVAKTRSFEVVGVAVTAAARPYPGVCLAPEWCFPQEIEDRLSQGPPPEEEQLDPSTRFPDNPVEPGLVWLTEADVRSLASAEKFLSYVVNLTLDDPMDAPAFVNAHLGFTPGGETNLQSWQQIREEHDQLAQDTGRVLRIGSWLLGLLAVAGVAVLVGGRMADQTRRVGLLKAVGGTPRFVAVVLLAEYMLLALLAAAVGLVFGWLAAPFLADPGASLLGSAGAPSLTISTIGVVTAVALGVATVATFVPAVRAARTSTVNALADAARRPGRRAWVVGLSARLPVSLLIGLRVAARRPRRVVLNAFSIFIAVAGVVAVLAANTQIAQDAGLVGGSDPNTERANQVLLVITVLLLGLAAINAIVVTWATALDAKHSSALARALGATPGQVSTGLSAAQVLPAIVGALLGIPGGLALFDAVGGGEDGVSGPPLWQLLAVVPVTAVLVAVLTGIPARIGARRRVGDVLRSEQA
jgi:putative ABC transport system permease protein